MLFFYLEKVIYFGFFILFRWYLFFWIFAENNLFSEFRLFFFYFFMTYYKLFTK